jgi:hypothetical protein
MIWECTKCGKPAAKNPENAKVNTQHVQYPIWLKKGMKGFCFHCMKNTKQVVKQS